MELHLRWYKSPYTTAKAPHQLFPDWIGHGPCLSDGIEPVKMVEKQSCNYQCTPINEKSYLKTITVRVDWENRRKINKERSGTHVAHTPSPHFQINSFPKEGIAAI